jgi:hypothetical protein
MDPVFLKWPLLPQAVWSVITYILTFPIIGPVQAINDEGASGISQAGFSTIIGPSPTDLSPNNRDDIQVPVTLSWVDPGAEIGIPALEFEGMFFLDPSLGPSAPLTFNCQQPSFQVPANVSINTRYFWQVRSKYAPNDANN